jgi:hypothetical protein
VGNNDLEAFARPGARRWFRQFRKAKIRRTIFGICRRPPAGTRAAFCAPGAVSVTAR